MQNTEQLESIISSTGQVRVEVFLYVSQYNLNAMNLTTDGCTCGFVMQNQPFSMDVHAD